MGQTQNIARSSTDAIRAFYTAQRTPQPVAPSPSPWPTVGPVTTFTPRPPATTTTVKPTTLPVLKPKPPTVSAPKPIFTVPKPTVSVAPSAGPGVTVSMAPGGTMISEAGLTGGLSAFGKTPLPLILIGLAGLFIMSRKERR
jgi:hypothetical protein